MTPCARQVMNRIPGNLELDRAIFTMADQLKVAYGLSNGAIFNDLERPRSRHRLTLNISEMAKHVAIVTMEGE